MIAMMHSSTSSGNTLGYDLGDKKDKDQQVHVIHTEGVLISPRDVRTLNADGEGSSDQGRFIPVEAV